MERKTETLREFPIIAAVREEETLRRAILTPVKAIFLLCGDPFTLPRWVQMVREAGKSPHVHLDLMEGYSRDAAGVRYLCKSAAPDGVMTTRAPLVRCAKDEGMCAVLRVFLVDSSSVATAERAIHSCNPDYVEVMPGLVTRGITALKDRIEHPVIAGGMLETRKDVEAVLAAGAVAASTSGEGLWKWEK